jgi:hypothetical protein
MSPNPYAPLQFIPEEEPAYIVPPQPLPRKKGPKKPSQFFSPTPTIDIGRISNHAGYYLPGKIAKQSVNFLLDTGCTTSVISPATLKKLPRSVQQQCQQQPGSARTADGNHIPTHGYIVLRGRVRSLPLDHRFLVADISDDAILGMDYFEAQGAVMDFRTAELVIDNKRLPCTTAQGDLIVKKVYLPHTVAIPAHQEVITWARPQHQLDVDTVMIDRFTGQVSNHS